MGYRSVRIPHKRTIETANPYIGSNLTYNSFCTQGNKEEKAFGLRIGSLNTILSTKAKTPERATLLHVLIEDIRKNDPSALTFATDLSTKLKQALQCVFNFYLFIVLYF